MDARKMEGRENQEYQVHEPELKITMNRMEKCQLKSIKKTKKSNIYMGHELFSIFKFIKLR